MISDWKLIDCENCPAEMVAAGDLPWTFIGDVTWDRTWCQVICNSRRCRPKTALWPHALPSPSERSPYHRVVLDCHLFVTDDLLEVHVWFGQCDQCRAVYWARQGPPYRRLGYRCPVGV